MDILVVGFGGREHALCCKIAQSSIADKLYAAPGNPGIAEIAECIPIKVNDIIGLRHFALNNNIGLTVVGPEGPLAAGIVDAFQECGLKIFGPNLMAAQLEWDKIYAMQLMEEYGIPIGWFGAYDSAQAALAIMGAVLVLRNRVVVKNPYPAKGKGSFVCYNNIEAEEAVLAIERQQVLAKDSRSFLVMEYLKGEEASITAISDGKNLAYLSSAQDHKRLKYGDKGPMTGGMGAVAPAPFVTPELQQQIHEQIMLPTISAMADQGYPFKGVLYAGLILTDNGPKVIEFNTRFGDPEAQVILPLLKTDLVELMLSALDERLGEVKVEFHEGLSAACIVLASEGYGEREKINTSVLIHGIDVVKKHKLAHVFHAGTRIKDGRLTTSGGRILGVTVVEPDLPLAIGRAYASASVIQFRGKQFRTDIGQRALAYLSNNK